jgi:16S rRNA (cytosine967-C5)-methyltransferase
VIFIDAPCSGTGTWRRNPEAKWTLDEARLAAYRAAQAKLLDRGAQLAKPDTRIAYAVCSLLKPEGEDQVHAFCVRHPDWKATAMQTLTPARDDTDGFFIAILDRARR